MRVLVVVRVLDPVHGPDLVPDPGHPSVKGGSPWPYQPYRLAVETVREVSLANRRIERRDRDLARQLRRASMSVPLNINEGMYSRGKNRSARLTDAMGSAKESMACLEVAVAVGYELCKPSRPAHDRVLHRSIDPS